MVYKRALGFFVLLWNISSLMAQEMVLPLAYRPTTNPESNSASKKRAGLPFFDDFSYLGPHPDAGLWVEQQVYVNNTFCMQQPSWGVATFDGLNEEGRPYVNSQFAVKYADSLTSQPLNLSGYSTQSKIYLSFSYQPQGLGFAPETQDSLLLFCKNVNGQWVKIWDQRGTPISAMKSVILPINDTQYLHNAFQFRFVNIASPNVNDDVWILDYVRLDAGRNGNDTLYNDLVFTKEPSSILSPYTAMPYRHFTANATAELSAGQDIEVRNHYYTAQNLELHHKAVEINSSTSISSSTLTASTITPQTTLGLTFPSFPISYTPPGLYDEVRIRNTYYFTSIGGTDYRRNDTVTRDALFDNYFAYDDGSAEKSYFLYPALNAPAKTALEFHLNVADTLRGLAVYFGAQVPPATNKYFSIVVYKHLGDASSSDTILAQQDLFQVKYEPGINQFTTYAFNQPLPLAPGSYYIGITQPANFGSDSIYYGLDVNTSANLQHLYYNVDGSWYGSSINGTLMLRPIVGLPFSPTITPPLHTMPSRIQAYPNPVTNQLFVQQPEQVQHYLLSDIQGKPLLQGNNFPISGLNLTSFSPGLYFFKIQDQQGRFQTQQIIKH